LRPVPRLGKLGESAGSLLAGLVAWENTTRQVEMRSIMDDIERIHARGTVR
jgi:hypothetical protein